MNKETKKSGTFEVDVNNSSTEENTEDTKAGGSNSHKRQQERAQEGEVKDITPFVGPANSTTTSKKLYKLKNKKIGINKAKSGVANNDEVLLLNAPKDTDEIFRVLNIPSKKDYVNETLKDFHKLERYEDMFKGCEAFKGSYIKELANEYYLKILSVRELKAYLNEDAARFIGKFHKRFKKTILSDSSFYILAPREYFTKKYKGTEAKTFILFYRNDKDTKSSNYATIAEKDTLVQIYSSGEDFADSRKWLKYFDNKQYIGDVPSKLVGNLLIFLLLLGGLISIPFGNFAVTATLLGLFIPWIILGNIKFASSSYWNR